MGSGSGTCYPTQVNIHHLNPNMIANSIVFWFTFQHIQITSCTFLSLKQCPETDFYDRTAVLYLYVQVLGESLMQKT